MKSLGVQVQSEKLREPPKSARPVVDPADVKVPDGYQVEAVAVGLSFPTGMALLMMEPFLLIKVEALGLQDLQCHQGS